MLAERDTLRQTFLVVGWWPCVLCARALRNGMGCEAVEGIPGALIVRSPGISALDLARALGINTRPLRADRDGG